MDGPCTSKTIFYGCLDGYGDDFLAVVQSRLLESTQEAHIALRGIDGRVEWFFDVR